MWEELMKLFAGGASPEAMQGLASELAMKGSPDGLLAQLPMPDMNLAGMGQPQPVTSWGQIMNPQAPSIPAATFPSAGMANVMPNLPGNQMITMTPPAPGNPPFAPGGPVDPSAAFGVLPNTVPPSTYENAFALPQETRKSVGLTPEQMTSMMKMMQGDERAQARPPANPGPGPRPPNQGTFTAPLAQARPSLADLLYRRR